MHAVLICLALCADDPAALTPNPGIEPPKMLDGRLKIELIAAEPDLVTPIGLAVDFPSPPSHPAREDSRGTKRGGVRVLVIESHTHFRPEGYDGPPADRIRLLQDTDGDGRPDVISTFFEGTVSTMNIAVHRNGWVYVATRRDVFRIRDTDGDGTADRRETLVDMQTAADYPHNGLSGFAFDFAGNVYFSLGENYGADYTMTAADGTVLRGGRGAGCIFRCRPDGSKLSRFAVGFWNPFQLCFDTYGRMFAVDNDPGNRPPCRLLAIVEGGDYGYRRRALEPFISWNGELPGTLPMLTSTGEAPTGIVAYESDGLPDDYRGNLLVTSWGEDRIDRYKIRPQGASFRASAEPLVVGGEHFRPSGITPAPDGSLYVTDWADRSYTLHKKGRLWRISARNPKPSNRPQTLTPHPSGSPPRKQGIPLLARRASGEGLESAHRPLRESSARHLAADPKTGRELLTRSLKSSPDPRVRSVGLAALIEAGADSKQLARQALADPVPAIREQAVRTLPQRLVDLKHIVRSDDNDAVKAAALRRIHDADALPLLLTFLDHPDPFLRQAARQGLKHTAATDQLTELASHKQPSVRRAALLLLREQAPAHPGPILLQMLRDADPNVRFVAVQWIGERKLTEYRPQLLEGLATGATTHQLLEAYLASLALLDGVMDHWDPHLTGDWWTKETETFDIAARLMGEGSVSPVVKKWVLRMLPSGHASLTLGRLHELLQSDDLELRAEAVRTLRRAAKIDVQKRSELLRSIAEDARQPADIRAEAVIGIDADDPAGRESLVALATGTDPAVRQEALRTLQGAKLTGEQRRALTPLLESEPAIRESAARVLGNSVPDAASARDTAHRPERTDVEGWLKLLDGPADPKAGERLFFHPKGPGCYRCHRIEGRGHFVGPGFLRAAETPAFTRRQLVESILQPSRNVSPGYIPWTIVTRDGRVATGIFDKHNEKVRTFYNEKGELMTFPVDDIVQLVPQETSIMPANVADALTTQEFRDLIAYLMNRQ